jgi:hypothetical protein
MVKLPGREADHSPPSSDEVKNAWSYTPFPQYADLWRGAQLKAQRPFYLYWQHLYHESELPVSVGGDVSLLYVILHQH